MIANERLRRAIHFILAVLILAAGAVIMVSMIRTKPAAPTLPVEENATMVQTMAVEPRNSVIPVVGYGTLRPKTQIQIIPQVPGRLIYVHPELAPGSVIAEGELLFSVDPAIHESRVRLAQAEIAAFEAALDRHDAEALSMAERLANAEQMLAIDEADLRTSQRLFEIDRVGTQRELDLVHQKFLRTKDAVVELKSAVSQIPNLKLETRAQLDAARARLHQAEYDLQNTRISCPFRARVESVQASVSQVVTGMAPIALLTDVAVYEVTVGIDPQELRWLHPAVRPQALLKNAAAAAPEVKVRWTAQSDETVWRGRVTRFERIDEMTRTARLVIEVRAQDLVTFDGKEPPEELGAGLSVGVYCRVELPGDPLLDALWIPRHALHEDQWVFVFESDPRSTNQDEGRLIRREVPLLRVYGDEVLVDYPGRLSYEKLELTRQDRVVVSPLLRPMAGMKVRRASNPTQAQDSAN